MIQRQPKETATTRKRFMDILRLDMGYKEVVSPQDRKRLQEQDIFREVEEEYVPLNESTLRIIDIKQRVARIPRWDRTILETLAELKTTVSDLQRKVDELTEAMADAGRVYNTTIYDLADAKYELSKPLQIVLEEDEEETVARVPELNLYASADTDSEAIKELKQEIIQLYEDLHGSHRKLGPLPESWLQTLRKLIVKKNG